MDDTTSAPVPWFCNMRSKLMLADSMFTVRKQFPPTWTLEVNSGNEGNLFSHCDSMNCNFISQKMQAVGNAIESGHFRHYDN
jgi:hypothetical protein